MRRTIIVDDIDGGQVLGYNDGRVGTGEVDSEILYLLLQSKVIVEWNNGTLVLYGITCKERDGPRTTSEVEIKTSWEIERGEGDKRRMDRRGGGGGERGEDQR